MKTVLFSLDIPSSYSCYCICVHMYCLSVSGFRLSDSGAFCLFQVVTLSVRLLTSSLPSVWVWSTCSTSASTGSLSSSQSPAGLPTLRGGAVCECTLCARRSVWQQDCNTHRFYNISNLHHFFLIASGTEAVN